jgi:signal transduction histidine kinase/AmiR/NasT family two-component response regulator
MILSFNYQDNHTLPRTTLAGILVTLILIFSLLDFWDQPANLSPLPIVAVLAWLTGLLILHLYTTHTQWIVHGLLATLCIYFTYVSWYTGGVHAIALDCVSLLPACTLLLGWRSTLFWSLGCSSILIGVYGVSIGAWGNGSIINTPPDASFAAWAFILEISLMMGLTIIVILYDTINARHMSELLVQKDLLTQKKDELIKAQSHKDEFIAMISHEVKNPIHAILGFTDLMQEEMSASGQKSITHIQDASQQLLRVVSDILDFSQLQAQKVSLIYEPIDLHHLIAGLIKQFTPQAAAKNLQLEPSVLPHPSYRVNADRYRVEQILSQLISNAIKFSDTGTITLHTEINASTFAISVKDQGIGIAPSSLEKIFAGFEHASEEIQHRYGGTGLGLAICNQLAKLHQGNILAQSTLGQGAMFTVVLPLQPPDNDASATATGISKERDTTTSKRSWRQIALAYFDHFSSQARIYLMFMQALFWGMLYYRLIAPTPATALVDDYMMVLTQLSSLVILLGAPLLWVVSFTQIAMVIIFFYLCLSTGGAFSTSFVFGKMLMLTPLYIYSRQQQLNWSFATIALFGVLAILTYHGALPADSHVLTESPIWSFSGHLHLLGLTLFIPLLHKHTRKKTKIALIEHNAVLQETQNSLLLQHKLKDQFISTISHAFRTPMNAIIGFIDLMQEEAASQPQWLEIHSMINQSAHHLLTVIDAVLDQSQVGSGNIKLKDEVFDIHKTVRHAFQMFEAAQSLENVTLELHAHNIPQWVRGDTQRLTQILVNLLSNALKYTRQGSICLRVQTEHDGLKFAVSDTGDGISPEKLAIIFNRFEQTDVQSQRAKGHGLGLSITRRLIDSAQGHIDVQSHVGLGTTFSFWLPFPTASAPHAPTVVMSDIKISTTPTHFLIVDDQQLNRILARQVLQKEWPQCVCLEAENGLIALALLREHNVDCVLMDVLMPEMDGITATEHIRAGVGISNPQLPILGLTANANQQTRDKCLQAGMNAVIFKPFNREDLLIKIQTHLHQQTNTLPLAA